MEKKGFTLIELLAVIVILAVIALIATPIILGVIETARKGAAESSALGYLDAIEKQIIMNQLDSNASEISDGTYDLPMINITVKGELPIEGWVTIEKGQVTNYSMKIMDYVITMGSDATTEGEIAPKPTESTTEISYLCKRATTLHTEECTQADTVSYCSGAGYVKGSEKGTTIEYGRLGTKGENLVSGDAFDCDVDGSGTYDEDERFYYVSDLESNSNYAVLVYYNNVSKDENGNVVADNTTNGLIAYYYADAAENWHGPVTAKTNLPTTSDWKNVRLSNTSRTIMNELGGETTYNDTNTIENPFSYEGYAARLLTAQEVNTACNITVGTSTVGELDNCNYLMENTKYSDSTRGTYGYWLETPLASLANNAWIVYGYDRSVYSYYVLNVYDRGIRPVIEVLKSDIEI